MRSVNHILQDINQFQPIDNNWLKLDDLLSEIWDNGTPEKYIKQLFELLERFPTDESAGILWGLLHGIESINNYESESLVSIRRQPTEITTHMVRRIANAGEKTLADQSIVEIYQLIQAHPRVPFEVKKLVQYCL